MKRQSIATNLLIQKLTSDDLDQFAEILDQYRVFYGQPSDIDTSRNYVKTHIDCDQIIFLMAIINKGEAVGFCTLLRSLSTVRAERIAILNDLYICKEYRRRGYGLKLLEHAVSLAKSEGITRLKLETAKDNLTAQEVYKKHGWQRSGFTPYIYETGSE